MKRKASGVSMLSLKKLLQRREGRECGRQEGYMEA